jgi:excisionase family DNA binding protein
VERIALSISETAAALGVPRKAVSRLIQNGALPLFFVGHDARIPTASLHQWINDNARSYDDKGPHSRHDLQTDR